MVDVIKGVVIIVVVEIVIQLMVVIAEIVLETMTGGVLDGLVVKGEKDWR